MKIVYASLFLLFTFNFVWPETCLGQNAATVSGSVQGSEAKPIEFATVALLAAKDSTVKGGAITDAKGHYKLEGVKAGQYLLRVHFLGYNSFHTELFTVASGQQLALSAIQLQSKGNMLGEVQVTAQRPLIEMVGGKILYHVQGNDALHGTSAKEVISSAPGVTHDRRGYQLNGRGGAKVLIDGRDRNVTLESVLSSLRAADILRVELLSNPSAHYDAQGAGGVINIVTKRNVNEGLSGTYGLSSSIGRDKLRYSSNLGLNYKKGITTLFSDVRINRFANSTDAVNMQIFEENSMTWQRSTGKSNLTSLVPSASLGGELRLSPRSKLGFELWGSDGNSENLNASRRESKDNHGGNVNLMDSEVQTDYRTLWGNLYYKHQLDSAGQHLRFDANYQRSNNLVSGRYDNTFLDLDGNPSKAPFILYSHIPAVSDLLTTQLDYELPLPGSSKFDLGAKYSLSSTENDVRYERVQEPDNSLSRHYRYEEALLALYSSYQFKFKGLGLVLGLRAENTNYGLDFFTDGQRVKNSYWSLFPSISASQQVGEAHQFSYAASRRIQRQPYEYMNPFVQYMDEVTFVQGNPGLRPAYSYNFDVQHSYKYQYFTSLGYSYTDDVAVMTYELLPETNITRITIDNLAAMHNISFSLSAPYQVASWWRTNNSLNGLLNKFKGGTSLDAYNEDFNLHYSLRNTHSFQLPSKWRASLSLSYYGPSVGGMYYNHGWFTSNIGLSKKVLKEKGTLSLSAQDIFRSTRTKMRARYDGSEAIALSYSDTQRIGFSFTYSFGNNKVKRTQHSRTNYEEQSRMNSRTN